MARVSAAEDAFKLFVGNLDWSVSWQELKDHMKGIGCPVAHVDVFQNADGRAKGCGMVEFSSQEELEAALTNAQDSVLKGRSIFLRIPRDGQGSAQPPRQGRGYQAPRILVENLPRDYKWHDLKDLMRSVGPIKRSDVFTQPDGAVVGVVQFVNGEDAQAAIATFNQQTVDGNVISLRIDAEGSGSAPKDTKQLYVGQLAWGVSSSDLQRHFETIGSVARANVATEPGGRSRGFGFVEFHNASDAARAIQELNETELKGRRIFIKADTPRGGRM